jgi:hypothetical protein
VWQCARQCAEFVRQCAAVCGSVWQCAAVCGSVRQCAAIDLRVSTLIHRYTAEESDIVTVRQCAAVRAVCGSSAVVCDSASGSVR